MKYVFKSNYHDIILRRIKLTDDKVNHAWYL